MAKIMNECNLDDDLLLDGLEDDDEDELLLNITAKPESKPSEDTHSKETEEVQPLAETKPANPALIKFYSHVDTTPGFLTDSLKGICVLNKNKKNIDSKEQAA